MPISIPTDADIIATWQANPFPDTVRELCSACHSDSRPIRVLCEAGLMGYSVVRSETLPRMCEVMGTPTTQEKVEWTDEKIARIKELRDQGKSCRKIADELGYREPQVNNAYRRYVLNKER